MEMERLSRLTRLTPLITSYESLSEGQKAEVATSLQKITKDFPVDQCHVDEMTPELRNDRSDTRSDYLRGYTGTLRAPNALPRPVTRDDSADSALDEATSDLKSSTIATESTGSAQEKVTSDPKCFTVATEPTDSTRDEVTSDPRSFTATESAGFEPPPTRIMADQAEGPLTHSPGRVSSMLAALYSSFLTSVRQMGRLLSPRTVLPRPEEQDDETKVTQELSQAQRRLVVEEEGIWKHLSEATSKEGTEGNVSLLARELEDKSAKILTSYERRNNPPTSEVYDQSRIILRAMGVPCIEAEGGVEGEALAAAIVRDGLADYVASEDTVGFFSLFIPCFQLINGTGCIGLRRTSASQCHQRC